MELLQPESFLTQRFAEVHKDNDGWEPTDYSQMPVIEEDHILIAADLHFPKHDQRMIEEMLAQAYREEVERIVWAGDYHDMEEWSKWGIDDQTSNHRRNMVRGGKIMRIAAEMGFKQTYSQGNHETRVFRNTPLSMQDIASMMDLGDLVQSGQLEVTDSTRVWVRVGNWLIVHPAQYGSFPGVVASKLATRFQANVIAAHEHHWGMTTDETGQWVAISSGGLYDPRLHKYINNNVTAHRAWQRGFVILHSGQAQLYRGLPTPSIQIGKGLLNEGRRTE